MAKSLRSKRVGWYTIFWVLVGVGLLAAMGWSYVSANRGRNNYATWDQDKAPEQGSVAAGSISVSTDFEGAQALRVREVSPTHFWIIVDANQHPSWFAFQVNGAAGKTVSFDIMATDKPEKWSTVNPVYCYAEASELRSPDTFAFQPVKPGAAAVRFPNRAKAPPTEGLQKWHFIEKCSLGEDGLHFTQHFDRSPVIVAATYPLVPGLESRLIDDAARSACVKLITVGKSVHDRPLQIVRIAEEIPAASDQRPMIIVMARIHGLDQESGWVAWGLIHFLTSDDPAAVDARRRFIFAVVPCVDPDAAAEGTDDEKLAEILSKENKRPEPRSYARYFNGQRDAGHAPQLAITLEPTSFQLPFQVIGEEPNGVREDKLFKAAAAILKTSGILFSDQYRGYEYSYMGYPDWFVRHYHIESVMFGINSQCSAAHMTLEQMLAAGQCFGRLLDSYLQPATTKPSGESNDGEGQQ